jgi:hypothetical protein
MSPMARRRDGVQTKRRNQLSVPLDRAQRMAIEELAHAQQRSLSNMTRVLLAEGLRRL